MVAAGPATKLTSYRKTEGTPSGMLLNMFNMPGGEQPVAPFAVSHWSLEVGADSGIDQHSVRELWLIAAGRGAMKCGAAMLDVSVGDVISIEPGEPHTLTNTGDVPCEVFSVWWA